MVLRLTATKSGDGHQEQLSSREREVLCTLLENLTLMSALGSALALSLLCGPTELVFGPDAGTILIQYFIFFSFTSTVTYMVVAIEASLTLLYLEQFNDNQLHALLCEKAADLFVEPLLAFITSTVYMLVAGILFCVYVYGNEAGIGLSTIACIPSYKVYRAWHYLEMFDRRSFHIARQLEKGEHAPEEEDDDDPRKRRPRKSIITRQLTIVGHSKLLSAMKQKDEHKRSRHRMSIIPSVGSRRRSTSSIMPSPKPPTRARSRATTILPAARSPIASIEGAPAGREPDPVLEQLNGEEAGAPRRRGMLGACAHNP